MFHIFVEDKNRYTMALRKYNKLELFNQIDKLSITKVGESVITKYDDRVIKTANVSSRYEIFDISKYLKEKIEIIENNFDIKEYDLVIKGGVQSLRLTSDIVTIGDIKFKKSFYILNSSDRSRRLSFHTGLTSVKGNVSIIGVNNAGLTKKHLNGVTEAAEEASMNFNTETFDQQVADLKGLLNHSIRFSELRKVILGDKEFSDVLDINHKKFDAFKNSLLSNISMEDFQRKLLYKKSIDMKEVTSDQDFIVDAFTAFHLYLRIFNKQDSHIIKNETDRIMGITLWAFRAKRLASLGI